MSDNTSPEHPAQLASAQPESAADQDPIYAVGIGPGNPDYLTNHGRQLIAQADIIVGFETVIDTIADSTNADLMRCKYGDQTETLTQFANRVTDEITGVAVLMGDPNVSGYQFLGRIEQAVHDPVRVVPGISSIQLAASRARTPLEDSTVVTLHKRGSLKDEFHRMIEEAGKHHLLILPRPYDWMPTAIADYLIGEGVEKPLETLVLEHLTHPHETIFRTTLGELAQQTNEKGPGDTVFSDMTVLVIRRPQ